MTTKTPKRARHQLAKNIVDFASGGSDAVPPSEWPQKDAAAASLGRRGGIKGGKARVASMSPTKRRSEITKKAAETSPKKD